MTIRSLFVLHIFLLGGCSSQPSPTAYLDKGTVMALPAPVLATPFYRQQLLTATVGESAHQLMTVLEAEGIPAGPVLHHDEVFADPQILARGMVAEVDHARAGRQKTLGVPLKLSATPGGVRRAAPTLGQHDAEVRSRAKSRKKP